MPPRRPAVGQTKARTTNERCDPKQAAEWLETARDPDDPRNFVNRTISSRNVAKLSRAMLSGAVPEGKYDEEIPRIAFEDLPDGTERLVGGFHTLTSVVATETTWTFHVIHGVTNVAALNEQRHGNAGDEVRRRGVAQHSTVAGIARQLCHFDQGFYGFQGPPEIPTAEEVADRADAEPLMAEALSCNNAVYKELRIAPAATGALYILLHGLWGPDKAKGFFDALLHGSSEPEWAPVEVLRKYLYGDAIKRTHGRGQTTPKPQVYWYLYLRTTKAIANGEVIQNLVVPGTVTQGAILKLVWWS